METKKLESKETMIEKHLNKKYDFRFNKITNRVEFSIKSKNNFEEIKDRDLRILIRELRTQIGVNFSVNKLQDILESDFSQSFNPFKEYFNNLPKWEVNKESEIEKLCNTLKTENEKFKNWSLPKWLIAVVATMLKENVYNHQLPILIGEQGIGKSTWIQNLVPQHLSKYFYTGTINPNNKDTLSLLSTCMLIDLDELANLNKNDISKLKELITKPKITFRGAYQRFTEQQPRRASFIGSINETEFLYDTTGTRRFLCYEVLEIEKERINIDLVLSEAYYRYLNGEKYWFDENDIVKIEQNNENFKVISPFEYKISSMFSVPNSIFEYHFTLPELYKLLFNQECKTQTELIKLGKAMTKLGYKKVRKMEERIRLNYYPVCLNHEYFKQSNENQIVTFYESYLNNL